MAVYTQCSQTFIPFLWWVFGGAIKCGIVSVNIVLSLFFSNIMVADFIYIFQILQLYWVNFYLVALNERLFYIFEWFFFSEESDVNAIKHYSHCLNLVSLDKSEIRETESHDSEIREVIWLWKYEYATLEISKFTSQRCRHHCSLSFSRSLPFISFRWMGSVETRRNFEKWIIMFASACILTDSVRRWPKCWSSVMNRHSYITCLCRQST